MLLGESGKGGIVFHPFFTAVSSVKVAVKPIAMKSFTD